MVTERDICAMIVISGGCCFVLFHEMFLENVLLGVERKRVQRHLSCLSTHFMSSKRSRSFWTGSLGMTCSLVMTAMQIGGCKSNSDEDAFIDPPKSICVSICPALLTLSSGSSLAVEETTTSGKRKVQLRPLWKASSSAISGQGYGLFKKLQ